MGIPASLETFGGVLFLIMLVVVAVVFYLIIHSSGDI
jgi:hypothetical protein